ncbi:Hint domain-containing protein [Vannielia litorea]|uniref:Hint domain-containing protein n=1 Tax=Vannielia litorea TaxID=1217970 RepID=UPI001BCE96C6|nr:Hint domain-containing protein [Vannielia litorea]
MPLTRRFEVSYLASNGDIDDFQRVAPATPLFEDAFSALGRGALISTVDGLTAVEDLLPGTFVETPQGPQQLLWIGSMTVFPESGELAARAPGHEPQKMVRVATDTFGLGRPAPDLMLGPRARLLFRSAACMHAVGAEEAFAPARAFIDGVSVIEISPLSPQKVWQLCFAGQQTYFANGVEVESFHPGFKSEAMHDREMSALFLALFPHVESFEDFGNMHVPRLTAFELENLRAA